MILSGTNGETRNDAVSRVFWVSIFFLLLLSLDLLPGAVKTETEACNRNRLLSAKHRDEMKIVSCSFFPLVFFY